LSHRYNTNIKPRNNTSNGLKIRIVENRDGKIKGQSGNGRTKEDLMAFEQSQSKNCLKSVSTLVSYNTRKTNLFTESIVIALLKLHSF